MRGGVFVVGLMRFGRDSLIKSSYVTGTLTGVIEVDGVNCPSTPFLQPVTSSVVQLSQAAGSLFTDRKTNGTIVYTRIAVCGVFWAVVEKPSGQFDALHVHFGSDTCTSCTCNLGIFECFSKTLKWYYLKIALLRSLQNSPLSHANF